MEAFDLNEIGRLVSASPQMDRDADSYEQVLFESAKEELLVAFNEHPVTREIEAGVDSDNISDTLGRGNLFTFIGFPEGSNPIETVRQLIFTDLVIKKPVKRVSRGTIFYTYPIYLPFDEIVEATPMPFESGNSWVVGIEEGISGFSNFLYKVSAASRSGKGIETKNQVLGGTFQPVPYLISMLSKFTDQLGGNAFTFL